MAFYDNYCNLDFNMPLYDKGWSSMPNFSSDVSSFNYNSLPTFNNSLPIFNYDSSPTFTSYNTSLAYTPFSSNNTTGYSNWGLNTYIQKPFNFNFDFNYNFNFPNQKYTTPSWFNTGTNFNINFDTFSYSFINPFNTTSSSNSFASHLTENYSKGKYTYNSSDDIYARNNASYMKNLTPEMKEHAKSLIAYANKNGYDVKISSGYRTKAEQEILREKYKNEPGRAAKNSPHCDGKAIDITVTKNGVKSDAGYNLLGQYAKNELGIRWGGDFTSYRERWHFDCRKA